MNNTLIDNSIEALSMTTTLRKCLAIDGIKTVSIATGYWDIPGLAILQENLRSFIEKEGTTLRLLIGKDPYIYVNQLKSPKYKDANYPLDFIKTDTTNLMLLRNIKMLYVCFLIIVRKTMIQRFRFVYFEKMKMTKLNFYILSVTSLTESQTGIGIGIVGSTNFTQKGLQGNAELNYIETAPNQVLSLDEIPGNKSHLIWFNEKWEISEPWNKQFLEQILKSAPITDDVEKERKSEQQSFTPYELYIKLLQIKFGDIVDKSLRTTDKKLICQRTSTNWNIK